MIGKVSLRRMASTLAAQCSMASKPVNVPGIALDIDGVLRKGNFAIARGAQVIRTLKSPLSAISPKFAGVKASLPFMLMSNGGGYLEGYKADELNKILGLRKPEEMLTANDMILCHTPIREVAKEYTGKYVIVAGLGDMLGIATDYGFDKAITLDEYSALFPYLSRLSILGYAHILSPV